MRDHFEFGDGRPELSRRRLRVVLEPRPQQLFDALLRAVGDRLGGPPTEAAGHAFSPRTIVVGDSATREWLEMSFARRFGIAAGLEMPSLQAYLERLANRAFGVLPRAASRALRPMALTQRIDALLDRMSGLRGEDSGTDPLLEFLGAVHEPRQRLQISAHLADRFASYRRERPEWLDSWEQSRDSSDLQAQIWYRLHQESLRDHFPGRAAAAAADEPEERTGTDRILGLPQALHAQPPGSPPGLGPTNPDPLLVFGLSELSALEARCLAEISRSTPVWLGIYSPIAGFLDPDEESATHSLIRRLARPASALITTLTETLELDHEVFEDSEDLLAEPDEPDTLPLLRQFQQQIRNGLSTDGQAGTARMPFRDPWIDHSLEVHDAFGPRREAEIVRDRLLDCFDRIPDLRADEVAILTTDLAAYADPLRSVFSPKAALVPGLALHFADRVPEDRPVGAAAFVRVLEILDGPLGLGSTFATLRIPPIARRFGQTLEQIEDLLSLAREAGITWGLDRDHRRSRRAPEGFDVGTWQHGLERLALGHLYGFEDQRDRPEGVDLPSGTEVPTVHGASERGERIESLWSIFQVLRTHSSEARRERPRTSWTARFRAILDDFLDATDPDTRRDRQLCQRAIDEFAADLALCPDEDRERPTGFDRARAMLVRTLDGLVRSTQFTGSITVAALDRTRPLPFRVICIVGLSDQSFPGDAKSSALDRLEGRRGPAGLTRRDDRSQAFLHAVLSATDRIVLTAPTRSLDDGSPRARSSVVDALLSWFDHSTDAHPELGSISERLVCRHPIRPEAPAAFRADGDPRLQSADPQALSAAVAALRPASAVGLGWFERTEVEEPDRGLGDDENLEPLEVDLQDLETFWNCPVRAFAQHTLRLSLSSRHEFLSDSEPQATNNLEDWRLNQLQIDAGETVDPDLLRRAGRALPSPLAEAQAAVSWRLASSFALQREQEPFRVPDNEQVALTLLLPARSSAPVHPARPILLRGELQGLSKSGLFLQSASSQRWKTILRGRIRQAVATLRNHQSDRAEPVQLLVQTKNDPARPERFAALAEAEALAMLGLLVDGYVRGLEHPLPFDPSFLNLTDKRVEAGLSPSMFESIWRDQSGSNDAIRLFGQTSSPVGADGLLAWFRAIGGLCGRDLGSEDEG